MPERSVFFAHSHEAAKVRAITTENHAISVLPHVLADEDGEGSRAFPRHHARELM
jgi:hypothetical protein